MRINALFSPQIIVLLAIFVLALALRFYQLSNFPTGFHQDEASLGYNGYSLLHTGRDENNHFLPLYIDMFGDNRPSGYHFLTIIPILFSGLTIFATRFPAAFFGSIAVFVFYFLAVTIFQDKRVGILAAFLGAVSSWSIVLSRASGEAIVALFFILFGFAFIIKSLKSQRLSHLLPGVVLITFSFFFYHTPRVFVPMFFFCLVVFLILTWRSYHKRFRLYFLGSFVAVACLALALVFLIAGGTGRYGQVNIFGFPETKLVAAEQIREDGIMQTGVLPSRFFHNKVTAYTITFVNNYFEYFSGNFLFMKGGLPSWYIVPNMGLLYLVELPFILLGILYSIISKNNYRKLLLVWLVVAPITASITVDDIPNINRAIVMFPILELFAAYGLITATKLFPRKIVYGFVGIIILAFLYNGSYFLHQYFIHAPIHRNWYRNEGFSEMVSSILPEYATADKIIVTKDNGGIYPLILFYMRYDPKLYQHEGSTKDREYTGFGKFFFVPQACPFTTRDNRFPKTTKTIYIESGQCPPAKYVRQTYLSRLDGTHVFHIVYTYE